MGTGFGFNIYTDEGIRKDAFLFGEAQSRIVVSIDPNLKAFFEAELGSAPHTYIGQVNAVHEICIDQTSWGYLSDWQEAYDTSLETLLKV